MVRISKKVLITGGLGYLGVVLANYLSENPEALSWDRGKDSIESIDILAIRSETPNKGLLKNKHKIIIADVSNADNIDKIVDGGYSTIFHFASAVSAACQENPGLGLQNIRATETVMDVASKTYCQYSCDERVKVIFPGSCLEFVYNSVISCHFCSI